MIFIQHNSILPHQLYEHFTECQISFPLNFDTVKYSEKLCMNASIVEVWDSEVLVGVCACYMNQLDIDVSYVSHIDVLRQYRQQGIGRMLIEEVIRMSLDKGFHYIQLEVLKDNMAALALYRKMGFTRKGDHENKWLLEKAL